jgi:hypothetical protein
MFRKSFSSFAAITLLLGASAFSGKKRPVPAQKNTKNPSAKQTRKRGADAQNAESSTQPHPQKQVQKHDVEPSPIFKNTDPSGSLSIERNEPLQSDMNKSQTGTNPEKKAVSKADASSQTLETVFQTQKEVEQQEKLPQKVFQAQQEPQIYQKELIKDGKENSSAFQSISNNNDTEKSCMLLKKMSSNLLNQIISFLDPRSVRKLVATNKAIRNQFETNPFVHEEPTPLLRNILNFSRLPVGERASALLPSFAAHSQKIILVENNVPIQPFQLTEDGLAQEIKKLNTIPNLQKQLTESGHRGHIQNESYEALANAYPENAEVAREYDFTSHGEDPVFSIKSQISLLTGSDIFCKNFTKSCFGKKRISKLDILNHTRIPIAVDPHVLSYPNVFKRNPLIHLQYLKEFYPLCAMQDQLSLYTPLKIWLDFGKYDLIHALPTISEIVKKKNQNLVMLKVRVMRSAKNLEAGTVSNQLIATPEMDQSTGRYTIPQMPDLKSLSILLNPRPRYNQNEGQDEEYNDEGNHSEDLKASYLLISLLNSAPEDLEELKIASLYAEPFEKSPLLMENLQKALNRFYNLKFLSVSSYPEFLACVKNSNAPHHIRHLDFYTSYLYSYGNENANKDQCMPRYIEFLNRGRDLVQINAEKNLWPNDLNEFFEPLLNALSRQSNLESFKCYITKPESLGLLNATLKNLSRIRCIEVECDFYSCDEALKSSYPERMQLMQLMHQPRIETQSLVIKIR